MKNELPSGEGAPITSFCRTNLEIQGNLGFSDEDLLTHRRGFRFAYQLCFTITLIGTILQSIPVLAIAAIAAFFAIFPPNHPFDYLTSLDRSSGCARRSAAWTILEQVCSPWRHGNHPSIRASVGHRFVWHCGGA